MILPKAKKRIRGSITLPPDKSITHRTLILTSLAEGESVLFNLLESKDTIRTFNALKTMGILFEGDFGKLIVKGKNFIKGNYLIDSGNSGTTARLLTGLLSSQKGSFIIKGDSSLAKRPMNRIIKPLTLMGASINSDNGFLPLNIKGRTLQSINYKIPIRSAQVKSSIILAALNSNGDTTIAELKKTRDHTERLIKAMGGRIKFNNTSLKIIVSPSTLKTIHFEIPGDISAAANFVFFCLFHKNCHISIRNVLLNPNRIEYLKILINMGANISIKTTKSDIEPIGIIDIFSSNLQAGRIDLFRYPNCIDEIPLFAVFAPFMDGQLEVINAGELRLKESDRIKSTLNNLKAIGIHCVENNNSFLIPGKQIPTSGTVYTYGDHRIEMAFAIFSSLTPADINIKGPTMVDISYPTFYNDFRKLLL